MDKHEILVKLLDSDKHAFTEKEFFDFGFTAMDLYELKENGIILRPKLTDSDQRIRLTPLGYSLSVQLKQSKEIDKLTEISKNSLKSAKVVENLTNALVLLTLVLVELGVWQVTGEWYYGIIGIFLVALVYALSVHMYTNK
jgi:hypothetical protein